MIIPLALALTSVTTADIRQSPTRKEPFPVSFLVRLTILEVEGGKEQPLTPSVQDGEDIPSFFGSLDTGASLKVVEKPNVRTISGYQATVESEFSSGTTKDRVETNTLLAFTPTAYKDGSIRMDINLTLSRPSVDASGKKTTVSESRHVIARLKDGHCFVLKGGNEIFVITPSIVPQ